MTKREMFANIATINADNQEIVDFCQHQIDLLDARKSNGKKTPTKTQKENVVIMRNIEASLENIGKPVTVTEMLSHGVEGFELTNQKASALLRKLVESGKVVKTIEGKKAYFSLA